MILTRRHLNYIRKQYGFRIDELLAKYLLTRYEEEPFQYVNSEQGLYEQIRKLVYQYEQGHLNISIDPPKQRLKIRYEALKCFCYDILGENTLLKDENRKFKAILIKNGLMEEDEAF